MNLHSRINANFVIKVADFGLSESVGVKEYFRQDETASVRLPLKWLPPESINDYIFSERSDVVSVLYSSTILVHILFFKEKNSYVASYQQKLSIIIVLGRASKIIALRCHPISMKAFSHRILLLSAL